MRILSKQRWLAFLLSFVMVFTIVNTNMLVASADEEDIGSIQLFFYTDENTSADNYVKVEYLDQNNQVIGDKTQYLFEEGVPVENAEFDYENGTSKVRVSLSNSQLLKQLRLDGNLYNRPNSQDVFNDITSQANSYTFELGGIGDNIELHLNYGEAEDILNDGPGDNPPQMAYETNTFNFNVQNHLGEGGSIFVKLFNGEEDITADFKATDRLDETEATPEGYLEVIAQGEMEEDEWFFTQMSSVPLISSKNVKATAVQILIVPNEENDCFLGSSVRISMNHNGDGDLGNRRIEYDDREGANNDAYNSLLNGGYLYQIPTEQEAENAFYEMELRFENVNDGNEESFGSEAFGFKIANPRKGLLKFKLDNGEWIEVGNEDQDYVYPQSLSGYRTLTLKAMVFDDALIEWFNVLYDGNDMEVESNDLLSDDGVSINLSELEVGKAFEINIGFRDGDTEGPEGPGGFNNSNFRWNTMNGGDEYIKEVYYKINDGEWVDELNENLGEGDKISLRMVLEDGFEIKDLFAIYVVDDKGGNDPSDDTTRFNYPLEDTNQEVAEKLVSEDGYTFAFNPEADSTNTSGEVALTADKALIRVQFDVVKHFDEHFQINFLYQEAIVDEEWNYVENEDGTLQYGIMTERMKPGFGDEIDGWEPESFEVNGVREQCRFSEDRKNNEDEEAFSYISSFEGENYNQLVEFSPAHVTKKMFGGYVTGDVKNEIIFDDPNIDELYVDFDDNDKFTEDEKVEKVKRTTEVWDDENQEYFESEEEIFVLTLDPKESYSVFAKIKSSMQGGIGWSYIDNGMEADDTVVEHGKVFVDKIVRNGETILDGLYFDEDGNWMYETFDKEAEYLGVSADGASGGIWAKNGDIVTLRLIPQYGYQLESAELNGMEITPQEQVSTFTCKIVGNYHLSGTFVKTEDVINTKDSKDVKGASIENGENATDTGNLSLMVTDATDSNVKFEEAVEGEALEELAKVDIDLSSIVSKGAENQYWETPITEFDKPITVGLELDDIKLAENETVAVVREHNGELTEIEAEYDEKTDTVSFDTNKFSTYCVMKKAKKAGESGKPEHKHTIVKDAAVAATCEKDGKTEGSHCSECKDVIVAQNVVKAKGHTWDSGKITKEATATVDGIKTFTCTVCKKTKTEIIPATGAMSAGEKIQDTKSKAEFVVTSKEGETPTVAYKAANDKKTKKVTIPATVEVDGVVYKVTSVADKAFKGNKNITSITIGSNVTKIGKDAFNGCKKVKTIKIGKNVQEIGANAFKGCSAATTITIPANVTKIGANAFKSCKKLKKIVIKSKKLTSSGVAKKAFSGVGSNVTVKVPKAKLKAYKELLKKKGLSKKVKVTK